MNPLTNVKNITKLNEIELASGLIHKKSWHDMYKESAWIFIGGLEYGLTEGDILAVFSQYGEIVNMNLVRDKKTGKSKGYCFLCYTNQKSTVLAVDNFNGIKLCNRTIRVDHVANYKPPKEDERDDEITKMLKSEGCAPKPPKTSENMILDPNDQVKRKKLKKEKKEKRKKRKNSFGESGAEKQFSNLKEVKMEKHDPGYDKYDTFAKKTHNMDKKHQEKNYKDTLGESSHFHEKYRSKIDQQHHKIGGRDNIHCEEKPIDRHTSKEKSDLTSHQHKELHKFSDREHSSMSKMYKKKRSSSSSDDSSRNHKDHVRHKRERSESKSKHLNSKRSHRDTKHSSSSCDDDLSSSSTSNDEKHKTQSKYSTKERFESYEEKRSFQEERNKYEHQSENSDYTSSKSRYYKTERYSERRSKNRYRSDEKYDTHHRNSYKIQDKR